MKKQLKISFLFTTLSTIGLGIIYPAVLSGIAFILPTLPHPTLITHPIEQPDLFHGRPSSINGSHLEASNLALTSTTLSKQVLERWEQLRKNTPNNRIPRDLLFASASGYDPDISVEAAKTQIPRIAKARKVDSNKITKLINQHIHYKLWGFIGTDYVNVLELNEHLKQLEAIP